jgi:hypothetical protein
VNEWRNKESVKEERREGGNQKTVQKAGEQVRKTMRKRESTWAVL